MDGENGTAGWHIASTVDSLIAQAKNVIYQFVTVTYDGVQFIEPVVQISEDEQVMEVVRRITEAEVL